MAVVAGVCRNDKGFWLCGFQKQHQCASALLGECEAILQAITLAGEKGWPKVLIRSESKKAIHSLQQNLPTMDLTFSTICKCKDRMLETTSWSFEYTPRAAYKLADRMAKDCRRLNTMGVELVVLSHPSRIYQDLLLEDIGPRDDVT